MISTHSVTLYKQQITVPTITQDYAAIRKIAAVRAHAVVKKLQLIGQHALHLVAAFSKIRTERALLMTQEIDYYYSQGRILDPTFDETTFRQQAAHALHPIDEFEQQITAQFDEATQTHNLTKINDEIFTPAMFERYDQTIYNALISLHIVYTKLAVDVKFDEAWLPENLPFQRWQEVPTLLQCLKQQPTRENVVALLLADPYNPVHVALAYALYGDDNQELQHFLTLIGYSEALDLLPGCATTAALFGEHNATIHLELVQNPLFFTLVTTNDFQSLETAFAAAIAQFSAATKPLLTQQLKQEAVLFAYIVRKSPVLVLTTTGIRGKGRWFKTIDVPYAAVQQLLIRDGLCQINHTTIATTHFEREDDALLSQLINMMQVITATQQARMPAHS